MYGSYGLYSGNGANFSSVSNLYKPAGIMNISSSYISAGNNPNNINTNGVHTSNPTVVNTSVTIGNVLKGTFQQNTNVLPSSQNIDYQQNPSPIVLPVRQTTNTNPPAIYTDKDKNSNQVLGIYKEQYSLPGIQQFTKSQPSGGVNVITINEQQNIVNF